MCKNCKEPARKLWLYGCATFLLLIALIIGLIWPVLSIKLLHDALVLRDGSITYNNWVETSIPIYMEVRLFNWTNTEDIRNFSIKPKFVELGPYVFTEKRTRVNITWNNDFTITFNQTKTWHFVPERSNGSLDDIVTNLNVMSAAVAFAIRDQNFIVKLFGNYIINHKGGSLFITKTVRELIFDGYDDPLLDFLQKINSPTFIIPFDKFGWFYDRNLSSSYDGIYNMFTGADNIHKLGVLNLWNNKNDTEKYHRPCGQISGTTGELWPPVLETKSHYDNITLFVSDMCRSLTLNYESDSVHAGINGNKFIGDERVFDNGQNYSPNSCFCMGTPSQCPDLLPGVLNISDCRYGAPAFISYPHFYLADTSYTDVLDGLSPNKEQHEFYMIIEPSTGIPLDIRATLQINILLQPISGISLYEKVPHVMVPMIWISESTVLPDNLVTEAKLAINLPYYGSYISYGLVGLGLIIITIGIILTITKKWMSNNHMEFHNDEFEEDDELRR